MPIDPHAEALRLIASIDSDYLSELARDPIGAIEVLFSDIRISERPPAAPGDGCAVDGTYAPGPPPRITVATDVTPARRRFTTLHELGHHLIENDDVLNDLDVPDAQRRDEDTCNEVAASILLPEELVSRFIVAGDFTAEDVANLYAAADSPSRMACCVAAVRRLHVHGCVILGRPDGTADFIAHQPATPWRIARGTNQGPDSLLVRAGTALTHHARGQTTVRFASGKVSSPVFGDAFDVGDGWVFMVVAADSHSPWIKKLNFGASDPGDRNEPVECPRCDHAFRAWWAPCPRCGDHECPSCHHCSCESDAPSQRTCTSCMQLKAVNLFDGDAAICVDCR